MHYGLRRCYYMIKRCTICREEKPLEEFNKSKKGKLGRMSICRDCAKKSYITNRDKILKRHKEYRKENSEKMKEKARIRYKEKINNQEFKQKLYIYGKEYRENNKERANMSNKLWRQKLRMEILTHYGGNPPKCTCCGELFNEFLTMDHINGKGIKYGKSQKLRTNTEFYLWLKKNNYPEGYRVLCYNCNCSIGHYGYCPHSK